MSKIKITESQYNKLKNNIVESALITEASNTREEVMTIQKALNKCFKAGLAEDGICGKNTKSAIERYIGIPVFEV
jgi:hypothetical protein